MPKARITKLNVKKKVNKIVREHDNTTDLEMAEMAAHARFSPFIAPERSIPGTSVTAPPRVQGTIPG